MRGIKLYILRKREGLRPFPLSRYVVMQDVPFIAYPQKGLKFGVIFLYLLSKCLAELIACFIISR